MKIPLTKIDKVELIKAVRKGELDVMRVPCLSNQLEGGNYFLELMKQLDEQD